MGSECGRSCSCSSIVVDRGFIGGVMGSMLTSSVVDRGFIGGLIGACSPRVW